MLAIAILSIIAFVYQLLGSIFGEVPFGFLNATICVIAWWTICFPLAVVVLCIAIIVGILVLLNLLP